MDGYGNPYPYAYGYPNLPPPNYDPYRSSAPPPPPYLLPSNSFHSSPVHHPQQLNHSGQLQYPTPAYPPYAPPYSHPYDPYYNPHPNPSQTYPPVVPYNPPYPNSNQPSFHHYGSFSSHNPPDEHAPSAPSLDPPAAARPNLTPSSSSSSLYPVEELLANIHVSDGPIPPPLISTQPSSLPECRPVHGHHPSQSFSENFSTHASSSPLSGSQRWQIVPAGGQALQPSLKVLLLHGSLDIWVLEARSLPNMDMFSKTLGEMVGHRLTSSLSNKLDHVSSITSDPYVSITVSGAVVGRTYVISNSEYPVWMQHFYVPVAHHAADVVFLVKDNDIVGSQLIGSVSIPAEWIYSGEKVEGVYPILGSNGKPCKPGATLKLSIQYSLTTSRKSEPPTTSSADIIEDQIRGYRMRSGFMYNM